MHIYIQFHFHNLFTHTHTLRMKEGFPLRRYLRSDVRRGEHKRRRYTLGGEGVTFEHAQIPSHEPRLARRRRRGGGGGGGKARHRERSAFVQRWFAVEMRLVAAAKM